MGKNKYIFRVPMKVRDYECDIQGVVNNANYQHYMEHARHEFWEALGSGFAVMHDRGLDAFVRSVNITYKTSLKPSDKFDSCLNCRKDGAKLVFDQAIVREDGTVCAVGVVEAVAVLNGVLTRGEVFDELMDIIEKQFPSVE